MIDEGQIGWMKEYLGDRAFTDADRESVEEIIETFRALWKVAKSAGRIIEKPPVEYLPGSRKGELKLALDILHARETKIPPGRPLGNTMGKIM